MIMKIKLFITVFFFCFFLKTNIYSQGPIPIDIVGSNSPQELVNPNTGEFHYSIPILTVPNGAGDPYTLYLNYEGVTPEKEASWVGWGWSCTPGAIIRQVNGLPDDVKKNSIIQYSYMQPSNTLTFGLQAGAEIFDFGFWGKLGFDGSLTLRYNDMTGWSLFGGSSVTARALGVLKGGASVQGTDDGLDFGYNFSTYDLGKYVAEGLSDALKLPKFEINNLDMGVSFKFPAQQRFSFNDIPYKGTIFTYSIGTQNATVLLAGGRTVTSATLSSVCFQEVSAYEGVGYIYSGILNSSATENENLLMDYRTGKQKSILAGKVNTRYLSPSMATPDLYMVNGPGIKGTFRPFLKYPIIVGTQKIHSSIDQINMGEQGIIGADGGFGYGGSFGAGGTSSVTNASDDQFSRGLFNNTKSEIFGDIRDVVFRFTSDNTLNIPQTSLTLPSSKLFTSGGTNGVSTITPFTTYSNDEVTLQGNSIIPKNNVLNDDFPINRCQDCIEGFTIIGEGGARVLYGLPLMSGNESEYVVNPKNKSVLNNYILYSNFNPKTLFLEGNASSIYSLSGTKSNEAYPLAYLPTTIVSSSYVDNGTPGQDQSDFGSYIKFEYELAYKMTGTSTQGGGLSMTKTDLKKWRVPYVGYLFKNESLTNMRDDGGFVSYGYSQHYNLRTIKTKTHVAFFVTNKTNGSTNNDYDHGSATNRLDGHLPPEDESVAGTSSYIVPTNLENDNVVLEKILLYTLNDQGNPDKLLQTTYFQYDYSLQKNHPATINKSTNGRLTLKKVWTENYNIKETTIIPYEFSYEYPATPIGIPSEYQQLYNGYSSLSSQVQNPQYFPDNIDRWGHHQKNGGQRYGQYKMWNNQSSNQDNTFDPAAWQLKNIKLPSGSEIHVQYEQNDYAYVQNRPAMVFMGITSESSDNSAIIPFPLVGPFYTANKFYINVTDLPGTSAIDIYNVIKEQYIDKGEKVFFRFKYNMSATGTPEFVNGYTFVKNCGLESNNTKVWVELGDVNNKLTLPKGAAGKIRQFSNIHGNNTITFPTCGSKNEDVVETILTTAVASADVIGNLVQSIFEAPLGDGCTLLKNESYVRIPVPVRKLGGGIRVKRILNYETNTLQNQTAQVYGNEYKYITFDEEKKKIISSGVALNEPQVARQENSLVCLLDDGINSYRDKAIVGEHIQQFEGPLGESLLPAPRVEYSSIIVENINKGPSNIACSKMNYFTSKDFPTVRATHEPIQLESYNSPTTMALFTTTAMQYSFASMKLQFDIVSCSGLMKSVENYDYRSNQTLGGNKLFESAPVSWSKYEYYNPYDELPLFFDIDKPLRYGTKGKYSDLTIDISHKEEHTNITIHEGSLYFRPDIPVPIPSYGPNEVSENYYLNQEVRTQVTNHSFFPYRTVSSTDGIQTSSEIKAFDSKTGNAIMAKTPDAHNALTGIGIGTSFESMDISYSVPAYKNYAGMDSKTNYEDRVLSKNDYFLGTFDEFKLESGNKLTIVAPGVYPQSSLAKDANDKNAILEELSHILSKGAVIHVYQKEIDKLCLIDNISVLSDRVTADLIPLDGVNLPAALLDKGTVTVVRSAQTNQILTSNQSIVTRENGAKLVIMDAYTDELKKYQKIADKINTDLFNTRYTAYSTFYHVDQPLTFTPTLPPGFNPTVPLDVAAKYGIAVGDNITLLSLPSVVLEIKLAGNVITIRITKNGVLEEAEISNGVITDDIEMEQKLLYTGNERFGVDDDGRLTYGTINNMQLAQRLNWSFRCTNQTRNSMGVLVGNCAPNYAGPISPKSNSFSGTGLEESMLEASASTFKLHNSANDFDYSEGNCVAPPTGTYDIDKYPNIYIPLESYAYRDQIKSGANTSNPSQRNYYAGLMNNNFLPFDFGAVSHPANWVKSGTNEFLSPQGGVAQVKDVTGITSSVRYGLNGLLPACSGVNTKSNKNTRSIYFQSFENTGIPFNGSGNITNESVHTGKKSIRVSNTSPAEISNCIKLDNSVPKVLLIKFWARNFGEVTSNGYSLFGSLAVIENGGSPIDISTGISPKATIVNPFSSEQWELFEVEYQTTTNQTELGIKFSGLGPYFVDDLVVVPSDASISCNVYDEETFRLIAQFDDNHYPALPQYDAKGTPRRTMVESEAGTRTILESSVNVPRKAK